MAQATTCDLGKLIAFLIEDKGFSLEDGSYVIKHIENDIPDTMTVLLDNGQLFSVKVAVERRQ